MEAICGRGEVTCETRVLTAALHCLHVYCAALAAALISCCSSSHPPWFTRKSNWRCQNVRGVASLIVGFVWICDVAASCLRLGDRVRLVSALLGPIAWLAAAWLHVALWARHSTAPVLYLAIYWLLSAVSSILLLYGQIQTDNFIQHIDTYIYALSFIMSVVVAITDCVCFYDEVANRLTNHDKSSETMRTIGYKHNEVHFYSKITFFWINPLLYRGYEAPLEKEDLGEIPNDEVTVKQYIKFKKIYYEKMEPKLDKKGEPKLSHCYTKMIWPNFYISGVLKLISDIVGIVPPLGLAVIIQYIQGPVPIYDHSKPVTIREYLNNGYVMLALMTIALITQALLSQNSTHLVTVEGTRLKSALQCLIYDKCMRLAPWTSRVEYDEESPLLTKKMEPTPSGLLTNLISQDTYNIMSCVWICHYTWAIPLKITLILYFLYTKLGISAIIGPVLSVLIITPMQFYIGKKISDNSKDIGNCTDHRVSKMMEILYSMNVIKLYVWEDLFKEKILNLREVELKLLYKDSFYWSILTFSTQLSTILVTVITFTVFYFICDSEHLTAVNVFAGIALFNQLTVPLLILPVTVLMVVQAMVSTQRIKDFLDLPESNNITEQGGSTYNNYNADKLNNAFMDVKPNDSRGFLDPSSLKTEDNNESDHFSDEEEMPRSDYIAKFRNAVFSWGTRGETPHFEVDDLTIATGKLIMVVGLTGSGKSSFLSAILGEMYLERGDFQWNGNRSAFYAGQPPWLLEGTVRDNIIMDDSFCQSRYMRVLRATGLRPDLQLLPNGDATVLGSRGTPLSGGQRVRVSVARALYSRARLVALDEPLAALDAPLAKHLFARALVPAARAGRTVLVATNRLELMHYADLVIVVEGGRVVGCGNANSASTGTISRWCQLAAEARTIAARCGAGPPGGTALERSRLMQALTKAKIQRTNSDDATLGINEVTGAYLLAEVPSRGGGSWKRGTVRPRPMLSRQLSSPPTSIQHMKYCREIRRVVSADASNTTLQREASLIRRLLRPRPNRTLARWTPRPLRRLLNSEVDTTVVVDDLQKNQPGDSIVETTYASMTSNGDTIACSDTDGSISEGESSRYGDNECSTWLEYSRACGWWGAGYLLVAILAQALAVAADCWLAYTTAENARQKLSNHQMLNFVRSYALWCGSVCAAGCLSQALCVRASSGARRVTHDRLLHAMLHAPLQHIHATPLGAALQRFSADVHIIDKKLPMAFTRWAQLALLCGAAMLVNAAAVPWSLLALAPTLLVYLSLQNIYLRNARELQRIESRSAAPIVSLATETSAGGATIRVVNLQPRLRNKFLKRLDDNQNALLLLNSSNRWLGLTMDLLGAGAVCISMTMAICAGGSQAGLAGLAGTHILLLPAYLAHLAKCRADLDMHLAAVERVHIDINAPQEDYREDCPIPSGWQRGGKIELENISVQHEPGTPATLTNISLLVNPGEKVAICGRSGSGKSTLIASCVGSARVLTGRVLIDNVDISTVPLRVLRHRLVVLPQEATLFSGTLRENIDPLGVHTDQEIWDSLKVVGLHDFIAAQPAGLECSISGWSCGRRRRACCARAAVRAPHAAALLLDEPAAVLDAVQDRALLDAVAQHAPNTTILTVAHRISSVRNYERAIVLDRGKVIEQGVPAQLLERPTSCLSQMQHATQKDN